MAATLIWSKEALDDIDAIAEFISRDSPYHAQRVVDALFELGDKIAQQPLIGRIVPELEDPHLRERFLYSYRVLYGINAQHREIIAIIHGRRLLESIGERFD